MEEFEITPAILDKEQKYQFNSFRGLRKEEEFQRLKSRSLWLKSGDKNTSFFHKQYRARLSHNHISEISSSSGESFKGISQIKQAAEVHFQSLYREDGAIDSDLTSDFLSNVPNLVSAKENEELMKPFLEEEIINVIWSMDPEKAPGPNRFSFHFYRVCWNVLRKDLLGIVKAFWFKAKVGGSANSTFLALIPKEVKPSSFD